LIGADAAAVLARAGDGLDHDNGPVRKQGEKLIAARVAAISRNMQRALQTAEKGVLHAAASYTINAWIAASGAVDSEQEGDWNNPGVEAMGTVGTLPWKHL
jgi:hypothetical protein